MDMEKTVTLDEHHSSTVVVHKSELTVVSIHPFWLIRHVLVITHINKVEGKLSDRYPLYLPVISPDRQTHPPPSTLTKYLKVPGEPFVLNSVI